MKRQSFHRKSTVQFKIVKRNQYFWFPIKMFVTLSLTIFASSTRHQKDFVYETWADYFKWKFNARTFPELIFNFKQLVHLNYAHTLIIESNIIIWSTDIIISHIKFSLHTSADWCGTSWPSFMIYLSFLWNESVLTPSQLTTVTCYGCMFNIRLERG